jgi:hypothetical protein
LQTKQDASFFPPSPRSVDQSSAAHFAARRSGKSDEVARPISGFYDAVAKDEVGTNRKSDEINNLL